MTEVVTGEAVILDVPVARFPSRMVAVLIDMLIQIVVLIAVTVGLVAASGTPSSAASAGIAVSCYVLVVVGYSAAFETLTRGKTPGKMALGLRVVSDDGGPVRFRQALVRALTGAIEVWSVIGAPIGLITALISVKGKRLGDMFAGTYVIQERTPPRPGLPAAFAAIPPPLLDWSRVAQVSGLSDHNAEAAGSYLRRLSELSPAVRDGLGLRIATTVAGQVSPPPPPGTPPAAYLAAVLAIRREREQARLAAMMAGIPPAPPPGAAAAGAWPASAALPAWAPPAGPAWAPPAGPALAQPARTPVGQPQAAADGPSGHPEPPRADQPHADEPHANQNSGGFVPPA